jgi:hypothetical protein
MVSRRARDAGRCRDRRRRRSGAEKSGVAAPRQRRHSCVPPLTALESIQISAPARALIFGSRRGSVEPPRKRWTKWPTPDCSGVVIAGRRPCRPIGAEALIARRRSPPLPRSPRRASAQRSAQLGECRPEPPSGCALQPLPARDLRPCRPARRGEAEAMRDPSPGSLHRAPRLRPAASGDFRRERRHGERSGDRGRLWQPRQRLFHLALGELGVLE